MLAAESTSKEGGVALFWLAAYSIVIWLPYIAFSVAWRDKTSRQVKWLSSVPFVAMFSVVVVGIVLW